MHIKQSSYSFAIELSIVFVHRIWLRMPQTRLPFAMRRVEFEFQLKLWFKYFENGFGFFNRLQSAWGHIECHTTKPHLPFMKLAEGWAPTMSTSIYSFTVARWFWHDNHLSASFFLLALNCISMVKGFPWFNIDCRNSIRTLLLNNQVDDGVACQISIENCTDSSVLLAIY